MHDARRAPHPAPAARRPEHRAARAARGAFGAAASVLVAAASHAAAGGAVSAFSVVATIAVVLPLCVALAGRLGSLVRVSAAVLAAQFVYHWSFAGLGDVGFAAPATGGPHAAHLTALGAAEFGAAPIGAGQLGAGGLAMWLGHAAAAALTIALLHRGERAALALAGLVRRVAPLAHRAPQPAAAALPAPAAFRRPPALRDRVATAARTLRGPPVAA